MYRPTVRYDDVFKDYIDRLFNTTHLDRNQIIRCALFAAAYSSEYQCILEKYKKSDVTLPQPDWGLDEEDYWKNQSYIPTSKEQKKPVHAEIIRVINKGGIKYVPKNFPQRMTL